MDLGAYAQIDQRYDGSKHFDMCSECMTALISFLTNVPNREKEGD